MAVRKAEAVWKGTLQEGNGTVKSGSGLVDAAYTWKARSADESGKTNPEELLGAAHATCFAMFLSNQLAKAGFTPTSVRATANVKLRTEGGLKVEEIQLDVDADVPGVSQEKFMELAEAAKTGCPISVALASVPITMNAKLASS
jgi:lipoyl-dependent peroxiredoxin